MVNFEHLKLAKRFCNFVDYFDPFHGVPFEEGWANVLHGLFAYPDDLIAELKEDLDWLKHEGIENQFTRDAVLLIDDIKLLAE